MKFCLYSVTVDRAFISIFVVLNHRINSSKLGDAPGNFSDSKESRFRFDTEFCCKGADWDQQIELEDVLWGSLRQKLLQSFFH